MKTGYLHVDGNDDLARAAAAPRHWAIGLAVVIVAQWVMWQSSALASIFAGWLSPATFFNDSTTIFAVANLFYLVVPTALIAALALYVSRRTDGRSAKAIGLDAVTPPLALVWSLVGLFAAIPHIIAIAANQQDGLVSAIAVLVPATVVQAGAEEILLRGVILGFLCARHGARNGIVFSALLFALWHVYVGQSLVDAAITAASTFLFGLTAGVLTLHYANLGPALGLHVVWNVAGYLSAASEFGDDFWAAWVATFDTAWTLDHVVDGDLVRLLIVPLLIETLIVLAACRETVRKLV